MKPSIYTTTMTIGQQKLPVVITRMRRKTLSLNIVAGELVVKMPQQADLNEVLKWVDSKGNWILKRMRRIEAMTLKEDEVWYLGKKVKIVSGDETDFLEDRIVLGRKSSIESILRERAVDVLSDCFDQACDELGIRPRMLRFRTMKRSWGRCSSNKEITLNLRLIGCDPRFIRYVCIHELVHLKHMNHSKEFWQEVRKYVIDLDVVKKQSVLNQEDRLGL